MQDRPQLDYAPPAPAAAYRRWGRWLLRWGFVVTLVALAVIYGPDTVRQVWYLRGQRRCMAYALPADTVVYANGPAEAARLLAGGYKPVASVRGRTLNVGPAGNGDAENSPTMSAGYVFPPLAEVGEDTMGSYAQIGGNRYQRVVLSNAPIRTGGFLHARRNVQTGEDRLVSIVFLERQDPLYAPNLPPAAYLPLRRLEINALVWRPASMQPGSRMQLSGLTTLVLTQLDLHDVRLFAGQPDPVNADHFTMAYSIDGQPGVIDGKLDVFDRVELQVRDGPATRSAVIVK